MITNFKFVFHEYFYDSLDYDVRKGVTKMLDDHKKRIKYIKKHFKKDHIFYEKYGICITLVRIKKSKSDIIMHIKIEKWDWYNKEWKKIIKFEIENIIWWTDLFMLYKIDIKEECYNNLMTRHLGTSLEFDITMREIENFLDWFKTDVDLARELV